MSRAALSVVVFLVAGSMLAAAYGGYALGSAVMV